jgi:hypothetical protein
LELVLEFMAAADLAVVVVVVDKKVGEVEINEVFLVILLVGNIVNLVIAALVVEVTAVDLVEMVAWVKDIAGMALHLL